MQLTEKFEEQDKKIERLEKELDGLKRDHRSYVVIPSLIKDIDAVDIKTSTIDIAPGKIVMGVTSNKPKRVYIAKYTTHDDYGDLDEYKVFADGVEAYQFVLDKREHEGATDIEVMPQLVN